MMPASMIFVIVVLGGGKMGNIKGLEEQGQPLRPNDNPPRDITDRKQETKL
jgi:hypothetical protein